MNRKLLVGTLVATALLLALVFRSSRPTAVYSVDVAQLLARDLRDAPVRVSGTLVHGSLCAARADCGYRFKLAANDRWSADGTSVPTSRAEISVRYDGCLVPDTFYDRPGIELGVIVEGERCRGCRAFEASRILCKSTGKYETYPDGGPRVLPAIAIPRCGPDAPRM
jgi:hypothetical protein